MAIVENDEGAALADGLLGIYDEAFFTTAYGHLNRAAAAVKDSDGKYTERVAFVRMGLDHTRSMMQARKHMRQFRRNDGQHTEAESEARRIWVEEIHPRATCERFPYAINWGPLRPGHGRSLGGLYPPDLHLKWRNF